MAFTSYDSLLFFLIVFTLYWMARRREWQNVFLLVASYVFYGWVHLWYALLLGLSTLADYELALGIARNRARTRPFMALSLLVNVGCWASSSITTFSARTSSKRWPVSGSGRTRCWY